MAIWQALKELNKQQLIRKNICSSTHRFRSAAIQAVANEDSQDKKVILARFEIKSLQAKGVNSNGSYPTVDCQEMKKADCLAKMGSNKKNSHPMGYHSTQLKQERH
jgi:hypothetical protein